MKLIFSLVAILVLCSIDKALTEAIDSSVEDHDYASDENTGYTVIFIPYFNATHLEESSEREKLLSLVIDGLEELAPRIDKNGPLIIRYENDYSSDEYYDEEEEDQKEPCNATVTETETQTETTAEIETKQPSILNPELQADCEKFLDKVLIACEHYWNSLSDKNMVGYKDFGDWLAEFKNVKNVLYRMDLLNLFFHLNEGVLKHTQHEENN